MIEGKLLFLGVLFCLGQLIYYSGGTAVYTS